LEQDPVNFRSEESAHQAMHGKLMIVRHHIGFPREKHFLQLLDIHANDKERFPIAAEFVEQLCHLVRKLGRYPVLAKAFHPSLTRADRVFHQGVAGLEMLGATQFIGLALHFFDLSALCLCLGARLGHGNSRQHYSTSADKDPRVDRHPRMLG